MAAARPGRGVERWRGGEVIGFGPGRRRADGYVTRVSTATAPLMGAQMGNWGAGAHTALHPLLGPGLSPSPFSPGSPPGQTLFVAQSRALLAGDLLTLDILSVSDPPPQGWGGEAASQVAKQAAAETRRARVLGERTAQPGGHVGRALRVPLARGTSPAGPLRPWH